MESLLQGRLRNTHLPISKATIPLYEAVVNSIHGIEEAVEAKTRPISEYTIEINILRTDNLFSDVGRRAENDIVGFEIRDDGAGFNDENWRSFNTLDSIHKEKKGSRGIGRLMWLKAFSNVNVTSVFVGSDGQTLERHFTFDPIKAVYQEHEPQPSQASLTTTISLNGLVKAYADSLPKSARGIATGILEHCLWYFVRAEGVPNIKIIDDAETVDLDDLFDEHMHTDARAEAVSYREYDFEITHVKFRASLQKANTLNWCAAGRLVKSENLKIPGLTNIMTDAAGTFTYAAYVTGSYLTERVFEQRTGFNIDEEAPVLLAGQELSFKEIRDVIRPRIEDFLETSLKENLTASAERIETFVTTTAPRYRAIMRHIDPEELFVDPTTSDRELDLALHKQLYKLEETILKQGHDVLVPLRGETEVAYQQRVEEYLQSVSDLKQSDLANYVTHRRIVLDLLEAAMYKDDNGKFSREDTIHELIVPMRKTSDDYEFRRENLWLIDERLSFHDFLASDKPLSVLPITSNDSGKQPDIVALRLYDAPFLVAEKGPPPASLTVIELKKPMRKGYVAGKNEKSDPILQALNYLSRLRQGAATRKGRPIPNADQIPGFIYVIADLTEDLIASCDLYQLTRTSDGMGYFGYHPKPAFNAYIQVISFDGLLKGAKERNRAFFDKLGLPSR
jgi:hypothetical protein